MSEDRATIGEDRETFLKRVRAALGRSRTEPAPQPPGVDESLARLASSSDDVAALFAERAAEVGMTVHRVTPGEVVSCIVNLAARLELRRVAMAAPNFGEAEALAAALRERGIEVVDVAGRGDDGALFELDAGITDAQAALAETGTIVCRTDADHGRALSLVPPVHVAILHARDVLPDMIDYWRTLDSSSPGALPSAQAMITGPSKTADIEGELVTGVHGPGRVEIVLIEDA